MVGDVTDKGVPAALVMARTQSVLRGEAPRLISPGDVLPRANEILLPEMPARMFVTCLYVVLEPETGRVVYANAGHPPPYVRTGDGVIELRATGMPLGLLPGMAYEENEAIIDPRQSVLLYSDGVIEAHGPDGDDVRLPAAARAHGGNDRAASSSTTCSSSSTSSSGRGWDQEDDITLVALERTGGGEHALLEETDAGRRVRPTARCCSVSPCRASRATSERPWTGSPTQSRRSASRRPGSSD